MAVDIDVKWMRMVPPTIWVCEIYNVSGLLPPTLNTLLSQKQAVSIYPQNFSFLESSFVSPRSIM